MQEGCVLCPRKCGADRNTQRGVCGAPRFPYVAKAALHMWEEPCISGRRGSGAIFFCGCNMNCVFCQNCDISRGSVGNIYDADGIARLMLRLQDKGAHNVNLVSPAPFVPVLADAIGRAKSGGLSIPVVYNTNSYERVEALEMLDGLVDIYLPDLKYVSGAVAKKYSGTENYFEYAAPAIGEMFRQAGLLELDGDGIARKGIIIRHLVLPGSLDETRRVLDYIAESFPREITVSLMSQYVPCHKAREMPPLDRKLLRREYERAVDYCLSLGLENAFIQEMGSAKREYTPVFDGKCD